MDESTWYEASARPYARSMALQGKLDAPVVVVGGGYAGVCTALGLSERGVRGVVLLEQGGIGHGASGRNGGFAGCGYSLGEAKLLQRVGPVRARRLYDLTTGALDVIRRRIRDYAIECDAKESGIITANWFDDSAPLRAHQRLLAEVFGVEWGWIPRERLRQLIHSKRYYDGLFEPNAIQLQPVDYLHGMARAAIARGVVAHEDSRVRAIVKQGSAWRVVTEGGEVTTPIVVLACGGYLAHLDRRVDRSVLPIATYIVVTEPLGERLDECLATDAAIHDTRFAFDYYRPVSGKRLLWGGRISVRDRSAKNVQALLRRDILRVYPQLEGVRIEHAWSGLMGYPRHKMPQIGNRGDGLWWLQGFGGHGTVPACMAAERVASAIGGDDESWREFAQFGLQDTWRPLGYLGAQVTYWWLEARDRWKTLTHR